MEWWPAIRHSALAERDSKRQVLAKTRIHYQTLEKILAYNEPPGLNEYQLVHISTCPL
jgi:hypothetical protein